MRLGRLVTLAIAVIVVALVSVVAVASVGPNVVSATTTACASGGAVPDPGNNSGLVSDCAALLAARDTLAGTATLNWAANTPITEWNGVIVGGSPPRVTELSLGSMELTGEIPAELGNLSNLRTLVLFSNQLSGKIPPELGNLSNLNHLFLWGNKLSGEVPPELGDLSNLRQMWLFDNQLSGALPQALTGLTRLLTFEFHRNPGLCAPVDEAFQAWLQGISSAQGSSCAPVDSQADRAVLVELHNATNGENWENSTSWLSDRPIREWHGVTNDADGRVTGLYFDRNQLTGEIPMELGNLSRLQWLVLSQNQLTGEIPAELENLSKLQDLSLGGNQLTGEIPTELGSLTNLQSLSLWGNELTGTIPSELGDLSNLQSLWLYGNQLTSEIPTELGSLSNLYTLWLSDNQLTGEIPAELGNLSNLNWLSLERNGLTGAIPSQLGNLTELQRLFLGGNQLTGCIPQGLRDVPTNDLDQLGLPYCGGATAPGAPDIAAVTGGASSLFIVWNAPSQTGGSIIAAYDLRYIETAADETTDSNWTVVQDVWTTGGGALQYTLTGLNSGTEYDLQVRAVTGEGDGPWSATATGTPGGAGDCASDGAVPDPGQQSRIGVGLRDTAGGA